VKYQNIIVGEGEGVATITLNRPDKLNALNDQMVEELISAIGDIEEDQNVRVLVITGAGRAFCAGGDVTQVETEALKLGSEEARQYGRHWQKIILGLHRLSKPTIAMVNGVAIGGGFDIALACDMRVGSENAKFIVGYTRVGVFPDLGGTWLLPRSIGMAKAAEFIFTNDPIEAEEAARMGLLNRLVPASELETKTMELAHKIAKGPPIAIRLGKLQLYKGLEMDLETALEFEIASVTIAFASKDYREALAALSEDREPRFEGR
jgi:enoyl-CoA hydratase/carnithine racemase